MGLSRGRGPEPGFPVNVVTGIDLVSLAAPEQLLRGPVGPHAHAARLGSWDPPLEASG